MRFLVSRNYSDGTSAPCDGAKSVTLTRVDCRSVDDPKKVPAHNGTEKWWYDEGENHRIVKGQICRDFKESTWVIDLKDLAALLKFAERNREIHVRSAEWTAYDKPEIILEDH